MCRLVNLDALNMTGGVAFAVKRSANACGNCLYQRADAGTLSERKNRSSHCRNKV